MSEQVSEQVSDQVSDQVSTDDVAGGRVVGHVPVLDLSGLSGPGDLAGIATIEGVATVVVPRSLAGAYTAIPTSRVANTVFVPDGARVRVHTGSLSVGGDDLGGPDDVLIITGMLVVTSPVTGGVPALIHVTGSVLAPRGSDSKIGRVLEGTGSVISYRWTEDQDLTLMGGQVGLGGATLANAAGTPADLLILAGQAVVTGTVAEVGYRQIIAAGQVALPEPARDLIEPRLVAQGQLAWYRGSDPRVFTDDTTIGAEFLTLLAEPASLVVFGDLTVSGDVDTDLLTASIGELVVFGDITAPSHLLPTLQFLALHCFGAFRDAGDAD